MSRRRNVTDATSQEGACHWLNAGMSVRAVAVRCNAHFSTISRLRRRFQQFGATVWDLLDRQVWQRVAIPDNVHELRTALQEEWDNIPQATIDNLVGSMRRRYTAREDIPDTEW